MYQLKEIGKIDHRVVSFYFTENGQGSIIKFGSYDKEAISGNANNFHIFKTSKKDSWQLDFKSLVISSGSVEQDMAVNNGQLVIDVMRPYFTMPDKDYRNLEKIVKNKLTIKDGLKCNETVSEQFRCYWGSSCDSLS